MISEAFRSSSSQMLSGAQSEIFQGWGGFVELGQFDKLFVKDKKKRSRREKFWSFFSQILLKLHFEWKINAKIDLFRAFFSQNQGTFFDFQKNAGEASLQTLRGTGCVTAKLHSVHFYSSAILWLPSTIFLAPLEMFKLNLPLYRRCSMFFWGENENKLLFILLFY